MADGDLADEETATLRNVYEELMKSPMDLSEVAQVATDMQAIGFQAPPVPALAAEPSWPSARLTKSSSCRAGQLSEAEDCLCIREVRVRVYRLTVIRLCV